MNADLEMYELLEDAEVREYSFEYKDLTRQHGDQKVPAGSRFIKLRKKKDILICIPWPSTALRDDVKYRGQVEIELKKLKQVGTVTEEEMGLCDNWLASNFAKARKLKRLLPQGHVEVTYKEYSTPRRIVLEQGVGISANGWSGHYKVQGPANGRRGKRKGLSVRYIDYSTISMISVEEALTCDNEHAREQAADAESAFKTKVSNGVDSCYSDAYKGLTQLQRLIERLANGNKLIPAEVGRISRAAREAGQAKANELAIEFGIIEKYQVLMEALEGLRERAKEEVAEVVAAEIVARRS